MITLVLFALFALASCIAAAGLIASTQNAADEVRAMEGLPSGSELNS
ncbi:MAG TPA: hypothetical protein VIL88_04770 [Devosia sp.]|jgi:hypothetical protein